MCIGAPNVMGVDLIIVDVGKWGQKEKVLMGIYYLVTNRAEASKAAQ